MSEVPASGGGALQPVWSWGCSCSLGRCCWRPGMPPAAFFVSGWRQPTCPSAWPGAIGSLPGEVTVVAKSTMPRRSKARGKESDRLSELRAELSTLVRTYQRDIDRFDQAAADHLGVNRTDLRCLDICLAEAEAGRRLTPKDLAERSGMSPSAITTVLDRLERAGYVTRVRDRVNRRLVLVNLTAVFAERIKDIFAPVAAAGEATAAGYSARELEVLIRFFTEAHERRTAQIADLQDAVGAENASSGEPRP